MGEGIEFIHYTAGAFVFHFTALLFDPSYSRRYLVFTYSQGIYTATLPQHSGELRADPVLSITGSGCWNTRI